MSTRHELTDLPTEQGLAGFEGQMTDYLGQIITDVYGNPLCTTYVGENPDTHVISPHLPAASRSSTRSAATA